MRLIALLFALALAFAPRSAVAANQTITAFQASGQEAKDQAVVTKVMQSGSLQAAKAFEDDLVAVLGHAPAAYPQIERRSDMTIVRSTSGQGGMAAAILLSAINGKDGKSGTIATGFNTYPMAALLLGSIANERRDPRKAIEFLDRGLALQPDNLMLVTEKGAAMVVLRRFSDALALYENAEKIDFVTKMLMPGGEARLLRGKGFALIELKRLEEAQAAYEAALKLEPNHAGAKAELDYIRKLRAGGDQRNIDLVTGDKAKDGATAPAKP
jgi:tetratricopeptide (TPR) repeat protein